MPMLASIASGALKAFGFTKASGAGAIIINIIRDTYFKFVTLLLKGNTGTSTDAIYTVSPSFIGDASGSNIQSTINGVVKSDRVTPYLGDGFYSVQMNGTSDYLTVPGTNAGFNFGTNSFTIEGWFWTTTATQITLFEKRSGPSYDWIVFLNASAGYLQIFLTGVVATANATVLFPFGSWVHVALVRNGNVFTLYQNGVSVYTTTNAAAVGYNASYPVLIGADASGPRFWWPGYISNVRIVNGTAVYTTAFTPPTTPLTAITNTVLLTCNTRNFVDKSSLAQAVTVTTTPKISQSSPFVYNRPIVGSGWFNGTSSDYITGTASLNFGSSDLTVEAWLYPTNLSVTQQVYFSAGSGNLTLMLIGGNGGVQPGHYGTSGIIDSTGKLRQNAWNHVVVTRKGTAWRVFIDGVLQGYNSNYAFSPNNSSYMIGYGTVSSNAFAGYISDLRVINGSVVAAYDTVATTIPTVVFTPPTTSLLTTTGTGLLTLQYNGSPVNSVFVDNSNTTALVTRGGNATQGTFSPYGGNWSMYLNGSSYITSTITGGLGAGNFTIDGWVYFTVSPGNNGVFHISPSSALPSNGNGVALAAYSGPLWHIYLNNQATTQAGATVATYQWYHFAMTRTSGSVRLFINGTQVQQTYTDNTDYTSSTFLAIGGYYSSGYLMTGYVSNFRVIRGTSLYSAPFTTPTTITDPANTNTFLSANSGSLVDYSPNKFAITVTGTPTTSRFGPVSSGTFVANPGYFSTFFNGSSWMTSPASANTNIGTQDFTVELWFYMTQTASYGTVFNLGRYDTGIMIRIESTTYSIFIVGTQVYATGTAPLNTWVHLALVRKTGSVYLWANGAQVGTTVANSTSISPTAASMIGASAHATTERFFGYVSNLRLVIGNGLYTASFTPPTAPLTAITGTAYLALQNDTQVDSSPNNFVIVTSGGTPVIRTFNPFSGNSYSTTYGTALSPGAVSGSAYFDGTGDYITIPNNPLFSNFATTTNFTVEFWFYTNAVNIAQQMLVSHRNTSTGLGGYVPFLLWLANSTVTLYMSNNNSTWNIASAANVGTIYPGTWNHFALCRTNGTIRAFLNGIQTYTLANATVFATVQPLQVGMSTSETNTAFNGYISDVRIVNGVGVYGSGFIPPVVPLTPVKNTSVLFNFNNIGVFDSAGYNDVETAGTARISTSVVKYNSSSIYFGTKTDYLSIRSTPLTATLPGDFTIECWVYPTDTSLTSTWGIIDARASGATAAAWLIGLGAYSAGWLMTIFNGTTYNGTTRIQANEWTHCAWVRVGSTLTFYVNGVAGGTATIAGAITGGTTTVYIGTKDNGLAGYGTVGYIDDLRMTNGYARYTGAFTVPTSLLENGPAT